MSRAVLVAVGLGVTAEVLRRARVRASRQIPAQVSEAAERQLRTMRVNPCGPGSSSPRDYAEFLRDQRAALIAQFGSMPAAECGGSAFSPCIRLPGRSIPTAPAGCTLTVVDQWRRVALELADASSTVTSLRADLRKHADTLQLLRGLVAGVQGAGGATAKLPGDLNQRVWSVLARLSIALQGVQINHGDAEREAAGELVDTLTSPSSYLEVAGDVAGEVIGGVAGIAGAGVGAFLASNLGAIAVVGAAGWFAWQKGLL